MFGTRNVGTEAAVRTCSIEGCGRKYVARGYCGRWLTTGQLGPADLVNKPAKGLVCQADGCCKDAKAKGFCGTHYWQWRAHGQPGAAATVTRNRKGIPCEVAGCRRLADGDGLCRMHYERRHRRAVLGGPNALRAARGAGSRTRHGYRVITVNGRQVLEHRHVMEQHLGRPLGKGETVRHRETTRGTPSTTSSSGLARSRPASAPPTCWRGLRRSWPATAPNATCSRHRPVAARPAEPNAQMAMVSQFATRT